MIRLPAPFRTISATISAPVNACLSLTAFWLFTILRGVACDAAAPLLGDCSVVMASTMESRVHPTPLFAPFIQGGKCAALAIEQPATLTSQFPPDRCYVNAWAETIATAIATTKIPSFAPHLLGQGEPTKGVDFQTAAARFSSLGDETGAAGGRQPMDFDAKAAVGLEAGPSPHRENQVFIRSTSVLVTEIPFETQAIASSAGLLAGASSLHSAPYFELCPQLEPVATSDLPAGLFSAGAPLSPLTAR
jgi:hypothetical protein